MDCVSAADGWHSLVPVDEKNFLGCPKSCHVGCFSPELFVFLQRFLSFSNMGKKVTAGNPDEETN